MGTEVGLSFSSLRAQLENERSSLFKLDENIKKIVQTSGRFHNDRFNNTGEYKRGAPRLGGRNSNPDMGKVEDPLGKRKHETKTVFSRLSARMGDSDGEDEGVGVKRWRVSSAVSRELPSRADVVRAQGDDQLARSRNRRIFGSLLGTLHKFKQEEIGLQTKEEKKAQVERKIEEQARLQKEREQSERKTLFAEREHKKATIKALEAKMARVQEFEKWAESQKNLGHFILTKTKPHVYWLPKKMSDKAAEKLSTSRKYHEKCMANKRQELEEELQRIEQRIRPRGPHALHGPHGPHAPHGPHGPHGPQSPASAAGVSAGHIAPAEDNHKTDNHDQNQNSTDNVDDDKGKKRDKFAMDEDHENESDGDDGHEAAAAAGPDGLDGAREREEIKQDKEFEDNKLGTNGEVNPGEIATEAPQALQQPTEPTSTETEQPTANIQTEPLSTDNNIDESANTEPETENPTHS